MSTARATWFKGLTRSFMPRSIAPEGGFRGREGDVVKFVEANVVGTIRLIEARARPRSAVSFSFQPAPCMRRSCPIGPSMKRIRSG